MIVSLKGNSLKIEIQANFFCDRDTFGHWGNPPSPARPKKRAREQLHPQPNLRIALHVALINLENRCSVCAVYIRKSTEPRLVQDSNSLDAQREADGLSRSTVRASISSTNYAICANDVSKKVCKVLFVEDVLNRFDSTR